MTSLKKDIYELFTFPPSDPSPSAAKARNEFLCPILQRDCIKNNDAESEQNDPKLRGGLGVCSVYHPNPKNGLRNTTIVCPVRLYGNNYNALRGLAAELLEGKADDVLLYTEWEQQRSQDGIVLIGKHQGGERGTGVVGTFDWLAVRRRHGEVQGYAGIEVQAIDITGNYRAARKGYLKGDANPPPSQHNLNWENVNKRIVPQLMRKGRYLQKLREDGAVGIGFLVDSNVFQKVQARLSSPLEEEQGGDFVVHAYALAEEKNEAGMHSLVLSQTMRTSVEQLSKKFVEIGDDVRPIKLWLSGKFVA